METASSWDSYKETLLKVMDIIQPVHCFEWGVGKSTLTISEFPSVLSLDSVEHDPSWVDRLKPVPDNVKVIFEQSHELYQIVFGRCDEYDLIFVDGKDRARCLQSAKERISKTGAVVLHDAMREEYKKAIEAYSFQIFSDGGHTVILTDYFNAYLKINEALNANSMSST